MVHRLIHRGAASFAMQKFNQSEEKDLAMALSECCWMVESIVALGMQATQSGKRVELR